MNKAEEYHRHAAECRTLASAMDVDKHRRHLLEMAETWDRMADERKRSQALQEQRTFEPKDRQA